MKAKFQSEARSRRAMPWSKIVKRHLPANQEIKRYILADVTPTTDLPTDDTAPSSEERGDSPFIKQETVSQETVSAPAQQEEPVAPATTADPDPVSYDQGYANGFAEGEGKGFTEGEAKGLAEGEARGREIREEALREFEQTDQLLLRLIDDLKIFTETVIQDSENDLLQIALAIAQRIVRTEISQNPDILVEFVQDGLKRLAPTQTALIRVHPQDIEILMKKRPQFLEAVEGTTLFTIEPDPMLHPGDCLIETPHKIVDARPEVQLEEIKKKLLPEG